MCQTFILAEIHYLLQKLRGGWVQGRLHVVTLVSFGFGVTWSKSSLTERISGPAERQIQEEEEEEEEIEFGALLVQKYVYSDLSQIMWLQSQKKPV